MLPQLKLMYVFAKLAKEHGGKLLHVNNAGLLTEDLGAALQKQKAILSDARKNNLMTAYDVLPVIVEVKLLSGIVAKKLGISTKDKPAITVLEEILAASEARGGNHAKGIKDTLEWTRALFANPEIQDVLKMEMTEIERPGGVTDLGKFFKQVAFRSSDEITRINQFLKRAKQTPPPAETPAPAAATKKPKKPKPPKNAA